MQLTDYYHWCRVRQPVMSMRLDALILVFLFVFASASFVLSGPAAPAQEPQARKVYRIGFLRAGQPPRPGSRRFSKAYGSGDTSTAKM